MNIKMSFLIFSFDDIANWHSQQANSVLIIFEYCKAWAKICMMCLSRFNLLLLYSFVELHVWICKQTIIINWMTSKRNTN